MPRPRRRNSLAHRRIAAEVNMTPLMDLTFVLLILFIITVPILDYKTDVVPPAMNTEATLPETDPEAIQVTLDSGGRCAINGTPVAVADLEAQMMALKGMGRRRVRIRASGERPYEEIVALLRPAKHCGLEVQLETRAE